MVGQNHGYMSGALEDEREEGVAKINRRSPHFRVEESYGRGKCVIKPKRTQEFEHVLARME